MLECVARAACGPPFFSRGDISFGGKTADGGSGKIF